MIRRSTPLALARCALLLAFSAGAAPLSLAQQAAPRNPFVSALGALGLAPPKLTPMPDFVTRTRPPESDLHYLPIGTTRPEPPSKPLTRAEIEAQEADLSALRARDDVRGGQKPTLIKALSAAGRPVVVKKRPKRTCRITCTIATKIGHEDSMQ